MWASFSDIADRWIGGDLPADQTTVELLIADAEQVILAEYPGIQARIDAETLPLGRVTMVVAAMVSRVLRNPEGLSMWQQATGPFSQGRSFTEAATGIFMTDQEEELLSAVKNGKAFEVDLGYRAASGNEDLVWFRAGH